DDTVPLHEALGRAHGALSAEPETEPSQESIERVAALVEDRRWQVLLEGSHARALAAALDQIELTGHALADATLTTYAKAAASLAAADLAELPSESRPGAVAYAVIGTLLTEPVLVSLRRMAQEDLSSRRFG
ncbi:MAG: MerR family transcriptional regulator, partial [Actinomycetota bacterium]|nr:MerR family transcriptional regulator [Actinomycetota bacterium]